MAILPWFIHQNENACMIHMLQVKLQEPTQNGKHTPSSPRKRTKVAWSSDFVKISASWSWVGTWIKAMFPFSTLSLRKWYLTSMCLVFEWSTGFLATLVALVLSQNKGTWEYSSPVSHGIGDPNWLRQHTQLLWWIRLHLIACETTKKPKKNRETDKYLLTQNVTCRAQHTAS